MLIFMQTCTFNRPIDFAANHVLDVCALQKLDITNALSLQITAKFRPELICKNAMYMSMFFFLLGHKIRLILESPSSSHIRE